MKIIDALAAHEANKVEYFSIQNNNITEKGFKHFFEKLCKEDSKNKSILYFQIDLEKENLEIIKNIRFELEKRFRHLKLRGLLASLEQAQKVVGKEHPMLIDKLNDISYLYWSIGNSEDDKKAIISCIEYANWSKDLYEKRFSKKCLDIHHNIALAYLNLGEKTRSSMYFDGTIESIWKIPPRSSSPIKILCFDGGGVRGLVEIKIIEEIEKMMGKDQKISDHFDLICGTSTGGMLALGIGLRNMKSQDLRNLYWVMAQEIFGNSQLKNGIKNLWNNNGWYSDELLEFAFKKYLGEDSILNYQTNAKVFVTAATQTKNTTPNPVIIRNYTNNQSKITPEKMDCKIWEAARATSAAPTYFAPISFKGLTLIDGGVINNNPTELAYREAVSLWPDRDLLIISLGTGKFSNKEKEEITSTWSIIQTVNTLVSVATNAEKTHQTMKNTILSTPTTNMTTYIRLNPSGIAHIKLDTCKKQELEQLETVTDTYLKTKIGKLNQIFEFLNQDMEIKKFAQKEVEKLKNEDSYQIVDTSLYNSQQISELFFDLQNENKKLKEEMEILKQQLSQKEDQISKYLNTIIHAEIVGAKYGNGKTYYQIWVRNFKMESYIIPRRYSEFLEIHEKILREVKLKDYPPFPVKRFLENENVVKERVPMFQNYLQFLIQTPQLRGISYIDNFLKL